MVTRAASADLVQQSESIIKNDRVKTTSAHTFTIETFTADRTNGVKRFLEDAAISEIKGRNLKIDNTVTVFSSEEIQQASNDLQLAKDLAEVQKELDSIQFINGEAILPQQAVTHKKKAESPMDLFSSTQMSANDVNNSTPPEKKPNFYNLYIRYMALMGRILNQAEAEAHNLYKTIKQRTDAIDVLTSLISKINNTSGAIDWSKNEEMKKLVDKARELGVDIPQGKYSWKEDEKKLLKENIQCKKDAMEKMTQMERTDMQKFLQEASQMHQGRSNVLKMLKEVMDVLIRNLAP